MTSSTALEERALMKLLGMITLMFIVTITVDEVNRYMRESRVGHHIDSCTEFGGIAVMTMRSSMVCVSREALLGITTGNRLNAD
jgi:hypothetical protein